MKKAPVDHPDALRLVVEIAHLYVQCDDCGHSRKLNLQNLRTAASLGVHNYMQLCRKIRCSACPKAPVSQRNLTIKPTWIQEEARYTVA